MVVTDNQQISTLRQQKQTKHKYKKARIKYPVRWSRALFLYNGI